MNRHNLDISEQEYHTAYQGIFADLTFGRNAQKQKKAIILGGQPGAGKTGLLKRTGDAENFIHINGDDYRVEHPHYREIARSCIAKMAGITQPFINRIVEQLITELSNAGYNLVIEGTLRNADVSIKTCMELMHKGYHTTLLVVACDAELAWKSTLDRADAMAERGEYPRFVPIETYDQTVQNISSNLDRIIEIDCFDAVEVISRSGEILYPNENGKLPSESLEMELHTNRWKEKMPLAIEKYGDIKKSISEKAIRNMTNVPKSGLKERIEQKQRMLAKQEVKKKGERGYERER